MLKSRLALAAVASTLVLAGCQHWWWEKDSKADLAKPAEAEAPVAVTVEETVIVEKAEEAAPVAEACDVLEGRDWEAWINKMPGPGATPTIHVVGKVDVRTSGYTFEWKEGPMDRSAMPALRLKLVTIPPAEMAMQVITTEQVTYQAPAIATGYSKVIVGCGDATLAEITEIPEVQ